MRLTLAGIVLSLMAHIAVALLLIALLSLDNTTLKVNFKSGESAINLSFVAPSEFVPEKVIKQPKPEPLPEPEPALEPEPDLIPEPKPEKIIPIKKKPKVEPKVEPKKELKQPKESIEKKKSEPKPLPEPKPDPIPEPEPKPKKPIEEKIQDKKPQKEVKNVDDKEEGVKGYQGISYTVKKPNYPQRFRDRNQAGTGQYEVEISAEGELLNVKIVKSCGFRGLDREALKALKKATYQPATQNGKALKAKAIIKIEFRLVD